uniref:Reverse transcriptase domain-containing protein n=1 Tax=Haemonchus placei TaxID=6290 RepID=A0A0N4WN98_HAEPC
MYDGSTTTIRTAHGQTGAIDATVGVHQGSALSPFLFLLTMDVITEELVDGPLKTILYADDIALIAESKEELQDNLQKWQKVLAENGLRLNVRKTKFLSSEEGMESITDDYGEGIKKVQDFRYLGSDLAADGSVDQAVKSRINAAWMKGRKSTGILCDRRCSRTLKGKVYRAVVRPTMLYGSECWPLSKSHEIQLHSAEMRMLRWACGWTRLDRIRNEDVRTVMQTAPVQLKMRKQRLMVRTCPKKTTEPPDKEGNGVRGARQATTGSPKEEMAGRDQEGPRRSQGDGRRCRKNEVETTNKNSGPCDGAGLKLGRRRRRRRNNVKGHGRRTYIQATGLSLTDAVGISRRSEQNAEE